MSSSNEVLTIDFGRLGGPIFVGRQSGKEVRNRNNLDEFDKSSDTSEVLVPDSVYALNSSFFLGLFGDSIRTAGSREAFLQKYRFHCRDSIMDVIERGIVTALREPSSLI